MPQDEPRWTDVVDRVIEVRDGYLIAPDRPGLGIDLDDAGSRSIRRRRSTSPVSAVREDGSVAIR